jgi:LacI family transcriptional regulator
MWCVLGGSQEESFKVSRKRGKNVTLRDVAEATGFSLNTVSKVLNVRSTPVRVTDKTRLEILRMARRMGYRRNTAASFLAGGRSRTLGILLDQLTNPFGAPLAEAFEQEASAHGYQCFVGCTQYDGLRKLEYVNRFLEHHVEGLFLLTVWFDPTVEEALNSALSRDTAVVTVDQPWKGHPVPAVCANHRQGGRLLGEHLVEIGHRRILYLATSDRLDRFSVQERIRGIQEAIAAKPESGCVLEIANSTPKRASELWEVAMEYLESDRPPTVIAATHDVHALDLISGLATQGVRVPQNVAVVGFDDIQSEVLGMLRSTRFMPVPFPMTTVRQPLKAIGRRAAEILMGSIEHPETPQPEVEFLDVDLLIRASSRLPDCAFRTRGKT